MTTLEDRVSRLEGGYDHLATKGDLSDLKAEFKSDIYQLESRLIKWMVGLMVGAIAVASSIALVVQRLIGN